MEDEDEAALIGSSGRFMLSMERGPRLVTSLDMQGQEPNGVNSVIPPASSASSAVSSRRTSSTSNNGGRLATENRTLSTEFTFQHAAADESNGRKGSTVSTPLHHNSLNDLSAMHRTSSRRSSQSSAKPPSGASLQQQQQQQHQQNMQQLQTEISIKDELLKSQSLELVETHRRQADLEEQLAFFKIDAKFDSVANILLNSPKSNTQPTSEPNDPLLETSRTSPLPSAPYIGKSPFKLVITADPKVFNDANSSKHSESQESTTKEEDNLIIGLSREMSTALKQLQAEIERVEYESRQLRKNCLELPKERVESSADRLDDDIEIYRSRLGKLKSEVPPAMAGSFSLNSLFNSLMNCLKCSRENVTDALRCCEDRDRGPKLVNSAVEPSPLFIAAANMPHNESQSVGTTSPAHSKEESREPTSQLPPARFLQQPHRFIPPGIVDEPKPSPQNEELAKKLLSRLESSEQLAEKYKTEMDELKSRMDTIIQPPKKEAAAQAEISTSPPPVPSVNPSPIVRIQQNETPLSTSTPIKETGASKEAENQTEIQSGGPQTAIYISTPRAPDRSEPSQVKPHGACSASIEATASAYRDHLSGLGRRLDTHEHFVLNAFGSLLDRYVISDKANETSKLQDAQNDGNQSLPVRLVKSRSVQVVHVSTSDDEEEKVARIKSRGSKQPIPSELDANSSATIDYNKNFEKIFCQFKSDIQDIKQSFLTSMQQQQLQSAQQFSQLQSQLHQQQQQAQQQPTANVVVEPEPSTHSTSNRQSNREIETANALSQIIQAAEETIQTLSNNRAVLGEQIGGLESRRTQLLDDIERLAAETAQLSSLKEQLNESLGQYESQIQTSASELASKQQEMAVVDEMIADGRGVLSELNTKTGQLQTKYELLQQTAEQHRLGLETLLTRGTTAKNELISVETRLVQAKQDLRATEVRVDEKQSDLRKLEQAVAMARSQSNAIVIQHGSFVGESSTVLSDQHLIKNAVSQLTSERDRLIADVESARESLLVFEARALAKQQEAEQAQRQTEDHLESSTALAMRRETLISEIGTIESQLGNIQSLVEEQRLRKQTLQSDVDSLEMQKKSLESALSDLKRESYVDNDTSSSSVNVRQLENKLSEQERLLVEEKAKSAQYEHLARERQDEVSRLVGQLLVVHADYLNLHRQLRRMNAVFDGQPNQSSLAMPETLATSQFPILSSSSSQFHLPPSVQLPGSSHNLSRLIDFRESSPDLVVASGLSVKTSVERPSSGGSSNSAQGKATYSSSAYRGIAGSTSGGSQRSAESGYNSIA